MPPSYTRYSAQEPGKSLTQATSMNGTAPVLGVVRTRLRWVWPAAYATMRRSAGDDGDERVGVVRVDAEVLRRARSVVPAHPNLVVPHDEDGPVRPPRPGRPASPAARSSRGPSSSSGSRCREGRGGRRAGRRPRRRSGPTGPGTRRGCLGRRGAARRTRLRSKPRIPRTPRPSHRSSGRPSPPPPRGRWPRSRSTAPRFMVSGYGGSSGPTRWTGPSGWSSTRPASTSPKCTSLTVATRQSSSPGGRASVRTVTPSSS